MAIIRVSNRVYDLPDGAYQGKITDVDLQYSEEADEESGELTIEKVILQIESDLADGYIFSRKCYYKAFISRDSRLGKLIHGLGYELKPDEDFDIDQLIGLDVEFGVVHKEKYCNVENIKRI